MPRRDVAALVVRMAVENPQWGYTRIRGALSNLGHEIARTTVTRILHDHGIDPAPERSRRLPWKTFLQAHWEGLTACDLFTVEGLTLAGLQRDLVCFVIALQSRRVTIAGIHPQPYGTWMEQMARNLTDPVDGCLRRARSLIHDRDPLDTRGFGEILEGGGVQPIRLPPKSPNLNAYAERFVRSMKEECLSRVVPLGEGHVRLLVGEDVDHDHRERNHQGLDNQLLQRPPPPVSLAADVQRRERLGGLLNFYLWVSNSLSGRRWQLNQVPAVRCPPYVVEVRTGYRVSARHGERRVAVQGRVAPCRVVVGLEVGEFPLQIPPIPEEHLVQKFSPYRADQALYKGV